MVAHSYAKWIVGVLVALLTTFAFAPFVQADGGFFFFPWTKNESRGISCGYGCGKHTGKDQYAIDWNISGDGDCGKAVLAVAAGTVKKSECASGRGYGCNVLIKHNDERHQSFYAHMAKGSQTSRKTVCRGSQIGRVNETGCQGCGCHLHFAMYKDGDKHKPQPLWGGGGHQPGSGDFGVGQTWSSDTQLNCSEGPSPTLAGPSTTVAVTIVGPPFTSCPGPCYREEGEPRDHERAVYYCNGNCSTRNRTCRWSGFPTVKSFSVSPGTLPEVFGGST